MFFRGVASGTASRALALLDFWLAGRIKPIYQRVFLALLLVAGAINSALIAGVVKRLLRVRHSGPSRFYRLATPLLVMEYSL